MKRWTQSALLTLLALATARAADPVRVAVYTSNPQQLPDALGEFERVNGKGLIELVVIDRDTPPEKVAGARVIYAYLMSAAMYAQFAPAARKAAAAGAVIVAQPPDIVEHRWQVKPDVKASVSAYEYWYNGGVDNLSAFLAYCYKLGGGERPVAVPAPQQHVVKGIYHPRADRPFESLSDYLTWYRARKLVPESAPLAGILFYQTNYKVHDLEHIDALIAALEKRGIGAVPVFGWPVPEIAPLLGEPGNSPLRLLYSFNLGFAQASDSDTLERYGLHVIDLMTSRDSYEVWSKSAFGITPERLSTQVALPEIAGATEPIVVGTAEKAAGVAGPVTKPIPERIQMAVSRGARWLALQDKPNAEKRIGLIYFNNPPGKGNIGASYLNVFPTLVAVLARLRESGYQTGDQLPTERELEALLEISGRNIELWAPGELEALVEKGHVVLVSMKKYRGWFEALPRQFRDFVNAGWGPPEKSRLMTITSRDGEKFFVVPGVRMGNVFLGPQPLRTTFERSMEVAHNTDIPPPHSYIAAYLWYRHEFQADAVVHFGRHGTLEFLPGKNVGQAGWDSSEAILGDLPNAYYYIMDGGGESTTARRRSAAVMISHLTPMIVTAGAQDQFATLRRIIENMAQTEDVSPALQDQYRQSAAAEIRRLKLDTQLGLNLDKAEWAEVQEKVEAFLEATEAGPIPAGMHTVGSLPEPALQKEALGELIKLSLTDAEKRQWRVEIEAWVGAIFEGRKPALPGGMSPAAKDRLETVLASGGTWLRNLRESPERELASLVTILAGRFEASGMSGDPLRTPAGLPTGRNLHTFDPNLIPTHEAWELGKKMAVAALEQFAKDQGKAPEKVSMALWYGETIRHQGAMESEALYLMGVEPQWNARGVVDGLRLIPEKELGRPRVDVVLTLGGIYRDGFPDKVLLLDRASKLAASDGDNAISRHTRRIAEALKKAGVAPDLAEKAARARAFAAAPGDYGAGISNMVKQSKDAGNMQGLADQYLNHMNHVYSGDLWGEAVPGALSTQLEGNQAVIHSRTTNVYGVLDNDDFYDYAGGLNAATKTANGGNAPAFYVNDMKTRGKERVTGIQTYIATELNARYWNPKWIEEMQKAGYSGARAIANNMENLYGWQATSAEHMDGTFWQNSYDVYVADKNGLGMDKFFEQANPHAQQMMMARMLEVDRQGSYKFPEEQRAELTRRYVQTVARIGATCSANTCGNLKLHQYIAEQAALVPGLGTAELAAFGRNMAKATRWKAAAFANAPAALRAGIQEGLSQTRLAPPRGESAATRRSPSPPLPYVNGFRMAQQVIRITGGSASLLPVSFVPIMLIVMLVGAGILLEALRSAIKGIS
jgi:cobaltochelatase CobN